MADNIFQPPPVPPVRVGGRQPYAPAVNFVPGSSVDRPSPDLDTDTNAAVINSIWQAALSDPRPYSFVGGAQPCAPAINRGIKPGWSVDNPQPGLINDYLPDPVVPPLPTLRDLLTPSSVDNPPLYSAARAAAALSSWVAPDPFQPQRTLIAPLLATVVVTYVPSTSPWLTGIIASWQPADPQPQQRRATQIVSVDNPPSYADDIADMIQVVASWQPADPQPQQRRPTQVVSVDNPPGFLNDYLPDPVDLFYQPRPIQIAAMIPTAVVVTYVPPENTWLAGVVASWQPTDPQPQQKRATQIVSVDNPPSYTGALSSMYGAIQAWRTADPQPLQARNLYVQQQPVVVTYVPYTRPWLVNVVGAWAVSDPQPALPRNLAPGIPGQSVDNPPLYAGAIADLLQIVQGWQPVDLPPAQRRPTQIVSVDNPPPFRPFVPPYLPDVPFPLFPRPVAIPVRVDSPPPRQFAWFGTVVDAWQPVPPRIEPQRRVFPSGLAVRVDNPPFDMRARTTRDVIGMWQPYDQPPSIFAFYRHYASAKFIPLVTARIVKHPQLRGTLTVTTLVGIDGQPGLRSTDDTPNLSGDP